MESYSHQTYFAKKKIFKLVGGEIKIFDESKSRLLFFVKQKAFKLREDITVYTDESQQLEMMKIKARNIIDFSAAYDITELPSGQKLGTLRRRGWKSIMRDQWEILDPNELVIGKVIEDSGFKAFLRRFFSNLIPQTFRIEVGETTVGLLRQTFNIFAPQYHVDFSMDIGNRLNRQIGIAIVVLLQVIEGRQN